MEKTGKYIFIQMIEINDTVMEQTGTMHLLVDAQRTEHHSCGVTAKNIQTESNHEEIWIHLN